MQTSLSGVRTGRVLSFCSRKGYGFIEERITKSQVFAHYTSLVRRSNGWRKLWKGEYVNFVILPDHAGRPAARNVTGLDGDPLMCEFRDTEFEGA